MADMTLRGSGLIKPRGMQYDVGTPEGVVNQQAELLRKQLQNNFNTEWTSTFRRTKAAGISGPAQTKIMEDLHAKFRARAAEINDQTEQKLLEFKQVDQFGALGRIPNAAEPKMRMAIGPELEAAMYPKPEKPIDPIDQYGKLDVMRNRVETRLKEFSVRPAKEISSLFRASRNNPSKLWGLSPLTVAAYALAPKEKVEPTYLEVYDPSLAGKDEKGEFTGGVRKAKPEEIQEYNALLEAKNYLTSEQRPLMSNIMRTAITSPRMGGAIKEQVSQYLDNKKAGPEQQAPGNTQKLDASTAKMILQEAGGDADRARQIARSRGYQF